MDRIKEKHQVFHSFCLRPKIQFDGQDEQEEVILIVRAHPITQIYWIINGFILLIIFVLLNSILPTFLDNSRIFFLNIFSLVIVFSYLWFNFLDWFFNVGILTTKRVIDVDFNNVLYKEVTVAMLNKVEDVTSKSGGFFSSIFDYGDVFVQTAGTEENIEFMSVPQPSRVVKIINQSINQRRK